MIKITCLVLTFGVFFWEIVAPKSNPLNYGYKKTEKYATEVNSSTKNNTPQKLELSEGKRIFSEKLDYNVLQNPVILQKIGEEFVEKVDLSGFNISEKAQQKYPVLVMLILTSKTISKDNSSGEWLENLNTFSNFSSTLPQVNQLYDILLDERKNEVLIAEKYKQPTKNDNVLEISNSNSAQNFRASEKTFNGSITAQTYRFPTNYNPFEPGSTLSETRTRQFFSFNGKNNLIYILWQDQKTNAIIQSTLKTDYTGYSEIELPNTSLGKLAAAAMDEDYNFYYLTIKTTNISTQQDEAYLQKCTPGGKLLLEKKLDASKNGINLFRFNNYSAALVYSKNKLALLFERQMTKSSDGLNHQGGIAVLINPANLETIKNFGQTSGHSMDNYLTSVSEDYFLAADLGDNYPRGIHLHKFNDSGIKSCVVYTFKTQHSRGPRSNGGNVFEPYPEISSTEKQFYKWSNDNETYSSIGGLVETNNGYLVLFIGESDSNGNSLDNSKAWFGNPDAGNVGFVIVDKNFPTIRGNVVNEKIILTKGKTETGGFYNYNGEWEAQKNAGVNWLTNYLTKEMGSAKNLKVSELGEDEVLLLWETELWKTVTYSGRKGYKHVYNSTHALIIDKKGVKKSDVVTLGDKIRLNRRDELLSLNNQVVLINGNKTEKCIEIIVLSKH